MKNERQLEERLKILLKENTSIPPEDINGIRSTIVDRADITKTYSMRLARMLHSDQRDSHMAHAIQSFISLSESLDPDEIRLSLFSYSGKRYAVFSDVDLTTLLGVLNE
jgi:hypothetical protein